MVCIPQFQLDYLQRKCRFDRINERDRKCSDKSDHCCNGVCSTMSLVNTDPPLYESMNMNYHASSQATGDHSTVEFQVAEIRRTMQRIEMRLDERYNLQAHEASVSGEWKAIGTVLDRFFFIVYIILIGASIVIFFPRPN